MTPIGATQKALPPAAPLGALPPPPATRSRRLLQSQLQQCHTRSPVSGTISKGALRCSQERWVLRSTLQHPLPRSGRLHDWESRTAPRLLRRTQQARPVEERDTQQHQA
ncbi:hypothetical protein NDU88_006092 [Pleurodeles waltl]|uniref:Uncharacterized protein n=1 Tax=Pleurodeles waltl TaxID=8319 RepID=A0AAV7X365_PLEWA|nr:hypothetical protein NDU88_006092 [Pleurodeles waltl]